MKYILLSDAKWLKNKYVEDGLSANEIAKIIGCTRDGVRVALIRHGIKLRTSQETNKLAFERSGGRSAYLLLNDEKWLREKYEIENLSTREITRLVGAKTPNSTRQALIRKGIVVRSISDGLTINREDDGFVFNELNESVITGCLLGDAHLRVYNRESNNSFPAIQIKNKYYDHVAYKTDLLFGRRDRIKEEWCECNNKMCQCFLAVSLVHKSLLPIYRKWYPVSENYKKVVPSDIIIDKTVLLHWFLDDGTTSFYRKESPTKQIRMCFCSESFSFEDQNRLCAIIKNKFEITMNVKAYPAGTGYRINVPQSQVGKFYDVVGPPPVLSLAYKWK